MGGGRGGRRRKKRPDWGRYEIETREALSQIYWRVSARWPSRFTAEKFGQTPLNVIQDASRAELTLAAREAAPQAAATAAIYQSHGVKCTTKDFNEAAQLLYHMRARETVPAAAARAFLRLMEQGKLPSWVPSVFDIDFIKAAAGD